MNTSLNACRIIHSQDGDVVVHSKEFEVFTMVTLPQPRRPRL